LRVLLFTGHLLSSFLLRQMEFNADLYDVKFAGSESFAAKLDKIEQLNFASIGAQSDLLELWRSKRLPNNLPLFIVRKAQEFTEDDRFVLRQITASEPGRWFGTHPSSIDRVRRAEAAGEQGGFSSTQPAEAVFRDLEATARSISVRYYQEILGLELTPDTLVDTEESVAETIFIARCAAAFERYFEGSITQLRPFCLVENQIAPLADPNVSLANLNARRTDMKQNAVAAVAVIETFAKAYVRMRTASMAIQLMQAGFAISEKDFQEPGLTLQQSLLDRIAQIHQDQPLMRTLAGLQATAGDRLAAALQLLPIPEVAERVGNLSLWPEAVKLVRLVQRIGEIIPCLLELDHCGVSLSLLIEKRTTAPSLTKLEEIIQSLANVIEANLRQIRSRLSEQVYPFPHAKGRITVIQYAECDVSAEHSLTALGLLCRSYVDRLYALNGRLLGRLAMIAEQVESQVISG
jgi:hypothetical protein